MQIGYARVSRGDSQDLDPQLRALTDAGCSIIYQEEASGAKSDRPELALAIEALKPGDVLTVTTRDGERWEKQRKRAGQLMFSETIQEYRDQDGELVITSRSIGVRTERPVEQD